MRHLSPALLLVLICLLAAGGCDTSEPEDPAAAFGQPAAFVGAWSSTVREDAFFVVYPHDQTVIVLDADPSVEVSLEDTELPPTAEVRLRESDVFFGLSAASYRVEDPPEPGAEQWSLSLDVDSRGLTATLARDGADGSEWYQSGLLSASLLSRTVEGFSLAPIQLSSASGPPVTFSIEGRFPVVEVPGNVPTELWRERVSERTASEGWLPAVWHFAADGTFQLSTWSFGYRPPTSGTWAASGDELLRASGTGPFLNDYAFDADTLRVTRVVSSCVNVGCALSTLHEVNPDVSLNGFSLRATSLMVPTRPIVD